MINTYLKLFNIILINVDNKFITKKYKQYTANIEIVVKNVLIKIYDFIELIKYYYALFCWIYNIIIIKLLKIKIKFALQIFFKILNNLLKLNSLVSRFLVFSV